MTCGLGEKNWIYLVMDENKLMHSVFGDCFYDIKAGDRVGHWGILINHDIIFALLQALGNPVLTENKTKKRHLIMSLWSSSVITRGYCALILPGGLHHEPSFWTPMFCMFVVVL